MLSNFFNSKKYFNKKSYLNIIFIIVFFNLYLLYHTYVNQNIDTYNKALQEYYGMLEVYEKNNEIIQESGKLLEVIISPSMEKKSDAIDEFIKKNYNYKKNTENVIIIN
ncbi:hypothetical protein [Candidatus Deianiraea vastatrix]|uniref:Cell division protein FtsL n=1 Tax=Candidatus Deianiraea vastatrix TaxID=2163644 RepID=A0A5B8XCU0_9RICK|nr:hypothetical protein [Candidatus Deianiraea vastatrix]QED23123.1 hypothetical protein Deia_00316 [Candidatus Deianiraea vastatrix]